MTTVEAKERRQQLVSKLTKTKDDSQPIKPPKGMFFCDGHLDSLPLEKQSQNTRYCQDCLAVIEASTSSVDRDYWLPNKGVFITGGQGYGVNHALRTVCFGIEADVLARNRPRIPTKDTKVNEKVLQKSRPKEDITSDTTTKRKQIGKVLQKSPGEEKPKTLPTGRPQKDLPVERIMELHRQGLGTRPIARRLQAEGIPVSYVTVHRAIQKAEGQLELPILEATKRTRGRK